MNENLTNANIILNDVLTDFNFSVLPEDYGYFCSEAEFWGVEFIGKKHQYTDGTTVYLVYPTINSATDLRNIIRVTRLAAFNAGIDTVYSGLTAVK